MNARTKLNSSYINGCLLFAALVGWLTDSFWIFVITATVLICGAIHATDIRLGPSAPTGIGNRPRR